MADALKIGIAGLGTVGASLAKILVERRDMLQTTCGRPIEIVAVTMLPSNCPKPVPTRFRIPSASFMIREINWPL